MRYRIRANDTLLGRDNRLAVVDQDGKIIARHNIDAVGNLPIFDANSTDYFWASAGQLFRKTQWGSEVIGQALADQTLFWTGENAGFGFYRAGKLNVTFLFHPAKRGINDTVKLPPVRGQLVDSTCMFSSKHIWVLFAFTEGGRIMHRCFMLDSTGRILAQAESVSDDGSWLGAIRGKCIIGDALFSVTEEGIAKVQAVGDRLETVTVFPDTEPFVHTGCHLFGLRSGLHVVDSREIFVMTIARG